MGQNYMGNYHNNWFICKEKIYVISKDSFENQFKSKIPMNPGLLDAGIFIA